METLILARMPAKTERLALIMADPHLGNFLIASGVMKPLVGALEPSEALIVVHQSHQRLLARMPGLEHVPTLTVDGGKRGLRKVPVGLKIAIGLRRFRPDTVVSFGGNRIASLAAGLSGAPHRVGRPSDGYPRWFNVHASNPAGTGHHRQAVYAAIANGTGLASITPEPPRLVPRPGTDTQAWASARGQMGLDGLALACLHVGAGKEYKLWPCERFAALADWLHEQGLQPVLIGTAADAARAETVRSLAQKPLPSLISNLSRDAELAMLAECGLFVGNDSGPMHLAAALGAPVVGLFGPTDPVRWGPLGERCLALRGDAPLEHPIERKQVKGRQAVGSERSLESLQLEAVQQAVGDLLHLPATARTTGPANH